MPARIGEPAGAGEPKSEPTWTKAQVEWCLAMNAPTRETQAVSTSAVISCGEARFSR